MLEGHCKVLPMQALIMCTSEVSQPGATCGVAIRPCADLWPKLKCCTCSAQCWPGAADVVWHHLWRLLVFRSGSEPLPGLHGLSLCPHEPGTSPDPAAHDASHAQGISTPSLHPAGLLPFYMERTGAPTERMQPLLGRTPFWPQA